MQPIIAFDVETPNSYNDRISSIGVAVIEEGKLTKVFSSLVNPETHFDSFNIRLTGITPQMAFSAPAFPEIWKIIGPVMEEGVLLAHNASFDMRVLSCCLQDYALPAPRFFPYACTVQMGRKFLPQLPNHKLDTLCGVLHIPPDPHQADSDCLACARLFQYYLSRGMQLDSFLRTYDMQNARTVPGKAKLPR